MQVKEKKVVGKRLWTSQATKKQDRLDVDRIGTLLAGKDVRHECMRARQECKVGKMRFVCTWIQEEGGVGRSQAQALPRETGTLKKDEGTRRQKRIDTRSRK